MKLLTPSLIPGLFCLVALSLSGCSSSMLNWSLTRDKHEVEALDNPVEQIIPVWQESEGPGLDPQKVSRGFAGQIYFITRNRGLPAEVKGKVRIYVFDNLGEGEELAKPIHQFDYDGDSWKAHLMMSKLGPSYSVFIPYTREGRPMAECALRIRYTPDNGTPVFSQMVSLTMSGLKPPTGLDGEPLSGGSTGLDGQPLSSPSAQKKPQSGTRIMQVSGETSPRTARRVDQAGYEILELPSTREEQAAPQRKRRPQPRPAAATKPRRKPVSTDAESAFLGAGGPSRQRADIEVIDLNHETPVEYVDTQEEYLETETTASDLPENEYSETEYTESAYSETESVEGEYSEGASIEADDSDANDVDTYYEETSASGVKSYTIRLN